MHTGALSSLLGEESYRIQRNMLLLDKDTVRERDNNLLRRGVRICHCQCSNCNNYDAVQGRRNRISYPLCFQYTSIEIMYILFSAELGDYRYAHMSLGGNIDRKSVV